MWGVSMALLSEHHAQLRQSDEGGVEQPLSNCVLSHNAHQERSPACSYFFGICP